MKAYIELDVPEWQIGQNVTVYFPDTMMQHAKCELLKEQPQIIRCKNCKKRYTVLCIQEEAGNINNQDDWFYADGELKESR